ncbi:hypothetical protein [Pedobacter sp.]|uniref:hypothetical protein n=1 Tax=Pedobacter sp. TaxID=1411316 RepID=UPI00356738FF
MKTKYLDVVNSKLGLSSTTSILRSEMYAYSSSKLNAYKKLGYIVCNRQGEMLITWIGEQMLRAVDSDGKEIL